MKTNSKTNKSGTKGLAIIVAFLVATVICNISFIPYAIIGLFLDNLNWPDYILGVLFFILLIMAILAGIVAFKATYARVVLMIKDI
ncbi:MAG: hypothetical protein ACYC6S_02905 [Desulfobulbia bacterium]